MTRLGDYIAYGLSGLGFRYVARQWGDLHIGLSTGKVAIRIYVYLHGPSDDMALH